ncbi:hypothetical protein ACJX0J_031777 [Zea mays]
MSNPYFLLLKTADWISFPFSIKNVMNIFKAKEKTSLIFQMNKLYCQLNLIIALLLTMKCIYDNNNSSNNKYMHVINIRLKICDYYRSLSYLLDLFFLYKIKLIDS